ncbi:MAG: tetratricopeptide repeat protein [Candidatus Omnitrophica bacterium]|nr:tetratricopeptide repeat protein [Candidatus Omnitrophota bacterium]
MTRGIVIVGVCFWIALAAWADAEKTNPFQRANELYRNGKYQESARLYEEAAQLYESAEVYYNLGNAYFKDKKLGLAVLNYERARQLKPRDRDLLANLAYVNGLIEYKIEDKRNWFARKISQALEYVTFGECWMLALGAYFVFIVGLLVSLLGKRKLVFGKSGALALSFVIFCSLPLLLKYGEAGFARRGIVTEKSAEVRYGPSSSDRIAFRLAEGLPVALSGETEDWYRIQLKDGRSGWVPKTQVSAI